MQGPNSKSQKSIPPVEVIRLERSKSRLHNLQKTPSVIIHNPYIQQIGDRSTSKKRRDPSASFAPPILLDQNKTLLAENRQMAVLIHQKNTAIEALQQKLDAKVEKEISVFKEIQAEKKRFIQEILAHKENTDRHITQLGNQISRLQDQKQGLEKQYQIELKKKEVVFEQERAKENDQLKMQYQQSLTFNKSEMAKLKEEIDKKANELQLKQLEFKQKLAESNSKCTSLSDELKHLQQIKKIETAELKMHYENKIQKLHLDNRREKELFLMEHESQVKRLEDQIKRLKKTIQDLEGKATELKEIVEQEKISKDDYQEKLHYEAESNIAHIKELSIKERTKLEELLKTELIVMERYAAEEVEQKTMENKRLTDMLGIKQKEIENLLKEIDELRENRLTEIQQHQNLIRELESKFFSTLLQGEAQSQALKVKLARLREADISGLRQYHEHQIDLLSKNLSDKQSALANAREKHHQQLRKKIQMRKYFDLQSIKYKTRIIQLQNQIDLLKVKLAQEIKAKEIEAEVVSNQTGKEEAAKAKIDQLKNEECKQLQAIINGKDSQIQELTKRLELLKDNQSLERAGWQSQLKAQRQQHDLSKAQKTKMCETYEQQISKLKEILKRDKEELNRELSQLKQQHRVDFDQVMIELAQQRQRNQQEKRDILTDLKKRQLQVDKLTLQITQKQEQIRVLNQVTCQQKASDFAKQKQALQSFYKQQLSIKDSQLSDLHQRISQLSSDLRDARQNYSDLQHRMQQLIQSQSNLRQLQRKVMQMGKQNNLIKNTMQPVMK